MNNNQSNDTAGYQSGFDAGYLAYWRWAAGLFNCLLTVEARTENEQELLAQVRARPIMFTAFVAGVVSDLLHSLPVEDPWRHTEEVDGIIRSVSGNPFGTWADALDLHTRAHPDLRSDPVLAALVPPLSESAALVVHLCSQGRSAAFDQLSTAARHGMTVEKIFADGCAAIRWAIYRRGEYVGADDPYSPIVTRAWVRRAHSIDKGLPWDEARRARQAMQQKVADGIYECFTRR